MVIDPPSILNQNQRMLELILLKSEVQNRSSVFFELICSRQSCPISTNQHWETSDTRLNWRLRSLFCLHISHKKFILPLDKRDRFQSNTPPVNPRDKVILDDFVLFDLNPLCYTFFSHFTHSQRKQSAAVSDSDEDSDVRPSKLFERPNRTPSGLDADEISGLGTRDKKATFAKHRLLNSSDSDSDSPDGSLKTPDCGIDNILALFQVCIYL
jgi:hypothetical protein